MFASTCPVRLYQSDSIVSISCTMSSTLSTFSPSEMLGAAVGATIGPKTQDSAIKSSRNSRHSYQWNSLQAVAGVDDGSEGCHSRGALSMEETRARQTHMEGRRWRGKAEELPQRKNSFLRPPRWKVSREEKLLATEAGITSRSTHTTPPIQHNGTPTQEEKNPSPRLQSECHRSRRHQGQRC